MQVRVGGGGGRRGDARGATCWSPDAAPPAWCLVASERREARGRRRAQAGATALSGLGRQASDPKGNYKDEAVIRLELTREGLGYLSHVRGGGKDELAEKVRALC